MVRYVLHAHDTLRPHRVQHFRYRRRDICRRTWKTFSAIPPAESPDAINFAATCGLRICRKIVDLHNARMCKRTKWARATRLFLPFLPRRNGIMLWEVLNERKNC
jgi:hypothetical protein